MMIKPESFSGSQTEYWIKRLFFTTEEIERYGLAGTLLDINDKTKQSVLKDVSGKIIDSNSNFRDIPKMLGFKYEDYRSTPSFSILNVYYEFIKQLFSWIFSFNLSDKLKVQSSRTGFDHEVNIPHPETSDAKKTIKESPSPQKDKGGVKAMMKKMERRFSELEDVGKLNQMIDMEHDNWNLKLGEGQEENKRAIDDVINNCIDRFDIQHFLVGDFDVIYKILVKNNPILKGINNQTALKNYMLYKIILAQYEQLKRQSGS